MKQEIERKIMDKEDQIKKLNLNISNYKNKLKNLTFDEYEIEDYVITIALQMKRVKDEIHQLEFQVYELMQILKSN